VQAKPPIGWGISCGVLNCAPIIPPIGAVGGWRLAVGGWRLAVGGWRRAVGRRAVGRRAVRGERWAGERWAGERWAGEGFAASGGQASYSRPSNQTVMASESRESFSSALSHDCAVARWRLSPIIGMRHACAITCKLHRIVIIGPDSLWMLPPHSSGIIMIQRCQPLDRGTGSLQVPLVKPPIRGHVQRCQSPRMRGFSW
jgi:hypothetical protein